MKRILFFSFALVMALALRAEVAQTLYLIGEPAGGWDTSKGLEMTKTAEGVFEIDAELSGTSSFGFVKTLGGDWTAFNSCRYTPTVKGQTPVIGENEMVYTGDDSNDYSWDLGAGNWHFKVDTNTMKFILSEGGGDTPNPPAPQADLFFVGEVTNWCFIDEYKMTANDNVYTYTTGVIRGGIPFKLSDTNWKTAYTSRNEEMLPGNTYEVVTGDGLPNMGMAADVEDAELILDVEARTLTVRGTAAGVADVLADLDGDVPAEYFTLAGIRVENPGPGLYIVRRGAKVSKVHIR